MTAHLPLGIIVLVGSLLRAIPVLTSDFPLNDGALFLSMANDIRENGFALPSYASYNELDVPFVYPPLGFYLLAGLTSLGINPLDVLRLVPLITSITAIVLAHGLFTRLLRHRSRALVATGAFATMPHAYEWMIAGGGLTRSTGVTLAIGCILCAVITLQSPTRFSTLATGLLGGLSALTHPQAGIFAALSIVVLWLFKFPDRRRGIGSMLAAGSIGAVVLAPWLVVVLMVHGLEPLVSASMTGGSPIDGLFNFITLRFSGAYVEVLGVIAAFGIFVAALNRQWWILVWILAPFLVGDRKSLIFSTIPASIAVAVGFADLLRLGRTTEPVGLARFAGSRAGGIAAVLLVVATISAGVSNLSPSSPLHALPSAHRTAMAWVQNQTPAQSRFLIVSGMTWNLDAPAEWFPVLARRASVVTVQGWEWLGTDAFRQQRARHRWLQNCAIQSDAICVEEWTDVVGPVEYVYFGDSPLSGSQGYNCCLHLAARIEEALGATVVFQNEQVVIVRLALTASASSLDRLSGRAIRDPRASTTEIHGRVVV